MANNDEKFLNGSQNMSIYLQILNSPMKIIFMAKFGPLFLYHLILSSSSSTTIILWMHDCINEWSDVNGNKWTMGNDNMKCEINERKYE